VALVDLDAYDRSARLALRRIALREAVGAALVALAFLVG
jgi:hypothetical protein